MVAEQESIDLKNYFRTGNRYPVQTSLDAPSVGAQNLALRSIAAVAIGQKDGSLQENNSSSSVAQKIFPVFSKTGLDFPGQTTQKNKVFRVAMQKKLSNQRSRHEPRYLQGIRYSRYCRKRF